MFVVNGWILGSLHKQKIVPKFSKFGHYLCMATRGIGAAATRVTMATLVLFFVNFFCSKTKAEDAVFVLFFL